MCVLLVNQLFLDSTDYSDFLSLPQTVFFFLFACFLLFFFLLFFFCCFFFDKMIFAIISSSGEVLLNTDGSTVLRIC